MLVQIPSNQVMCTLEPNSQISLVSVVLLVNSVSLTYFCIGLKGVAHGLHLHRSSLSKFLSVYMAALIQRTLQSFSPLLYYHATVQYTNIISSKLVSFLCPMSTDESLVILEKFTESVVWLYREVVCAWEVLLRQNRTMVHCIMLVGLVLQLQWY